MPLIPLSSFLEHAEKETDGNRLVISAPVKHPWQELIRRWESKRELLCSAPGSYPNLLK